MMTASWVTNSWCLLPLCHTRRHLQDQGRVLQDTDFAHTSQTSSRHLSKPRLHTLTHTVLTRLTHTYLLSNDGWHIFFGPAQAWPKFRPNVTLISNQTMLLTKNSTMDSIPARY